jgi:hypothetical protein
MSIHAQDRVSQCPLRAFLSPENKRKERKKRKHPNASSIQPEPGHGNPNDPPDIALFPV